MKNEGMIRMEGVLHKHLKGVALMWLKEKVTDLVAPEVKLFVKRKKLKADAAGINMKRKEIRFIEVKTSKKDLKRDEDLWKDAFSYVHLGTYAYILSPEGVLEAGDLPPGYGWLEVDERDGVHVRKKPVKNSAPGVGWETMMKRVGRAVTNAYLYSVVHKEERDHTDGVFQTRSKAHLISLTCFSCKERRKYVVSPADSHVSCKHCCEVTPLDKGRKHVISRFNQSFHDELSSAIHRQS